MQHIYNNNNLSTLLKKLFFILIVSCLTGSFFFAPPELTLMRQFQEVGLDTILLLILLFILVFWVEDTYEIPLSFGLIILLFAYSLIYKWQTSDNFFTLGGIFPLSDAYGYFVDAQRLISGGSISGIGVYRPLYTALLSVLFWFTNGNLQLTVLIMVILNGISVYFATDAVRKVLKSNLAPAIYVALCFLFYRRFSGTLMTENLGFCLGNMALYFLLLGARKVRIQAILFGLALLTIALNARAGAFFILPTIAIWMAFVFRNQEKIWKSLLFGIGTIVISMALCFGVAKLLTDGRAIPNSNYAYNIYGLASGNKGWDQWSRDHPTASEQEVLEFAIQKIKENPSRLLMGMANAYLDYFEASNGAFSFLLLRHDRGDIANIILWALTLAGLAAIVRKREQKEFSIGLAFLLGIFLSIGFVPPLDSVKMRVYAATIPISCFLVVIGLDWIRRFIPEDKTILPNNTRNLLWPLVFSLSILFVTLMFPLLIKHIGMPLSMKMPLACPSNEIPAVVSFGNGSSIKLASNTDQTYLPFVEQDRFEKKITRPEQQLSESEKEFLLELKPGSVITIIRSGIATKNDDISMLSGFLITDSIPQSGINSLCVTPALEDRFYFSDMESSGLDESKDILFSVTPKLRETLRSIQILGMAILCILLLVGVLKLTSVTRAMIPFSIAIATVVGVAILLILHVKGIVPLAWDELILNPSEIRGREGNMFVWRVGTNSLSDTLLWDLNTLLLEDGKILDAPHESQSLITEYGGGGYILKGKILYFSTSDNSDPRENGRTYTLKYPKDIRIRYQILIYALALGGLFLQYKFILPENKR